MGKRSEFKRVERDYYPTFDPRAMKALAPHLPERVRYAEPCAGAGHLIDLLEPYAELAWAGDIEPRRQDVLPIDARYCEIGDADFFITNPPWSRPLLHDLIVHLSDQALTWLLFDANWANTRQAAPFMPRLRRIVVIGRMRWIEGTKMYGKDDCSWYLFDRPRVGNVPLFYGMDQKPEAPAERARRVCCDCGVAIDRFAKWWLQPRNGVPSPVHKDCAHPNGAPELAATPLLDWAYGNGSSSPLPVIKKVFAGPQGEEPCAAPHA